MDEKKSAQPAILVAVLALLGLSTLPRIGGTGGDRKTTATAPDAGPTATAADALPGPVEDPRLAWLTPLVALAGDGTSPNPRTIPELVARLRDRDGYAEVRTLIATMPDPDRTSIGYQFDVNLDGIQRSFESWGYVLDRYRFPWAPDPSAHRPPTPTPAQAPGAAPARPPAAPAAAGPSLGEDQPGLLVFRRRRGAAGASGQLVAVFLVLETPTRRIE